MPYPFRVEKRTAQKGLTGKRRKGRPAAWTNSWQKRLVVLRLCGLRVETILELLNILNQGSFCAKPRRAQQILADVLSDSYGDYCPRDAAQRRQRFAFFRSLKQRIRKPSISTSQEVVGSRRASITKAIGAASLTGDHSIPARESFHPQTSQTPAVYLSGEFPDTIDGCTRASDKNDEHGTNGSPTDVSPHATVLSHAPPRGSAGSSDRSHENLSVMSRSSVRSRIAEILKRHSFSSSLVSDVISVLGRRYSTSTLSTSSEGSVHSISKPAMEGVTAGYTAQARLNVDEHAQKIETNNHTLINRCCLTSSACLHREILDLSLVKEHARPGERGQLDTRALDFETLCFVAYTGACLQDLMRAISHSPATPIHDIDKDGKNFMFYLDPTGFQGTCCISTCFTDSPAHVWARHKNGTPHPISLDCLFDLLEHRDFNFEHIDHEGRNFLTYMCAYPAFNINWLMASIKRSEAWAHRLVCLSRLRDASGCFLIDYLSLHPDYAQFDEAVMQYLQPDFKTKFWSFPGRIKNRLLEGEDLDGPIPLQMMLQTSCGSHRNVWNSYDRFGLNTLMRYLDRAVRDGTKDSKMVSDVRYLVSMGANIHARSRTGATILHLAAQAASPGLVSLAISLGVDVGIVDKQGFSALDYAARAFNDSLGKRKPPQETGLAAKSATRILGTFESSWVLDVRTFEDWSKLFHTKEVLLRTRLSESSTRSYDSAVTLLAQGARQPGVSDQSVRPTIVKFQTVPQGLRSIPWREGKNIQENSEQMQRRSSQTEDE